MKDLLLKNGFILDIEQRNIIQKDIWISKGKIKEVSDRIERKGINTEVMDLEEKYILPGMIDCHTHVGIIEEAVGKIGIDNNETSDPVTPHMRAIDAINPYDLAFGDAVKSGITVVMSGPGSNNAVGGLSAALKTYGDVLDKMILRNPVGLKIALGENPIAIYGIKSKAPVTRMGTAALIRELFMRTQDYIDQKKRGKVTERNIRLEAVIPLLKGDISLRAHAHRADDIVTAIRIADEFNIKKLVIEHGTEANLIKEYLAERKIPVAYGPMTTPRSKLELKKRNYKCALELVEAGIKVALMTDHPYNTIDQLRTTAAIAVSEGMDIMEAVKCLTVHPAEILECDEQVGKLEPGYDADIAIFEGKPFDIHSKVYMTIIDGMIIYKKE
ncbi:amidohydrolase [Geosporobacter ferrireducens]|uniref:Amidohydrolase n=1 Tax=Geosporobacter ferrireducens TaxID=1424294 RepID=A0A1D8GJX9_9FIRM|nr:amidohydrolase [Geosporobacter ferrireducens]AOT71214.1 amidohydrolase [Geosporobacter ferrireducens]MTI58031.1 amidohydrolase [Geosporobacter ferrireducens]